MFHDPDYEVPVDPAVIDRYLAEPDVTEYEAAEAAVPWSVEDEEELRLAPIPMDDIQDITALLAQYQSMINEESYGHFDDDTYNFVHSTWLNEINSTSVEIRSG